MSGVPLSRRKQSRFEAEHQFYKLRDEITLLMIQDFGFSKEKYDEKIKRYRATHATATNVDAVVERWQRKSDAFNRWFIDKECDAVLAILRNIESEFTFGNSIYPSETPAKIFEFLERRKHINAAISNCYVLKQELQYIIRVLPVDMNKYARFAEAIDAQVALYKGVRQADNRFLKTKHKHPGDITKQVSDLSKSILLVINKLGLLQKENEGSL